MRTAAKVFVAFAVLVAMWRTWFGTVPERGRAGAPSPVLTSALSPVMRSNEGALVQMPRLVGVDDSFAKHVLERNGLRTGTIRLESSTSPWGSVIGQSIAPGEPVAPGARVDLVLAKGSVPEPCRLYWCSTRTGRYEEDEPVSSPDHGDARRRTSG
jgi:beta-lactam-binding protein with PASTA domain